MKQIEPATLTTIYCLTPSPIGELLLIGNGRALQALYMEPHDRWLGQRPDWRRDEAPFKAVIAQLHEYFERKRTVFDLPLAPVGTAFQQRVWTALLEIPFGVTTRYGELATRLGDAKASRAVGLANGRNPISIIVPCHRVIGANGNLTGYGGGLERKEWLLSHEGALLL
ncbi:methylated-DNA--[protein]-cysteine S-methyltransferase [Nevskia sp.]|uniref:methylated-DNA--[protein]-cysteine S-methyltransferase n=1 Tax=Nevskia sp. TaxID=1929292 RepID=UPI0025FDF839|nr:methylated-DNA--[protein]-cysteine S-methyltransferase [Nevskia sp.]